MIDPFLSGSPVFDGSVEEAAAGCTHVALIHGHDDHVGDTVDICKSTVAALIAIFEICMHVNGKGVEKVDPVNTIHARLQRHLRARGSFIGCPGGRRICLSRQSVRPDRQIKGGRPLRLPHGDTGIFSDMALISELYQPDIGIVPVGDRLHHVAANRGGRVQALFQFRYGHSLSLRDIPDYRAGCVEVSGRDGRRERFGSGYRRRSGYLTTAGRSRYADVPPVAGQSARCYKSDRFLVILGGPAQPACAGGTRAFLFKAVPCRWIRKRSVISHGLRALP